MAVVARTVLDEARKSLSRVQQFNTADLSRVAQLGDTLNFSDAIAPADRLVRLFRQFPIDFLDELPEQQLQSLRQHADAFYNILTQIIEFSVTQPDPYNTRNNIIQQLTEIYQNQFNQLHPIISYGATRQRDFAAMEQDFRAKMQRADDTAAEEMKKLQALNQDAQRVLDEVRKVAAEQGVSQEAIYFQKESSDHDAAATQWRNRTIYVATALGAYALLSAFVHKWEWIAPKDSFQAFQLGLSKVLIFAVLAYMLLLCARNFLAHTHNAIVNRHRQNALLTFNALVEAAGNDERRDVILTYAASCIFSPQDTGYIKSGGGTPADMPLNIIQALPKLTGGGTPH